MRVVPNRGPRRSILRPVGGDPHARIENKRGTEHGSARKGDAMKHVSWQGMLVSGLVLLLSVSPSWSGGFPGTNDDSDAEGNTGGGTGALGNLFDGVANTAYGTGALGANARGVGNTAYGNKALFSNTDGNLNTASGLNALFFNTTGNFNTASGAEALGANTTGDNNTANGFAALGANTIGANNTASGVQALATNDGGAGNTASGAYALQANTTGTFNTASGVSALFSNTTGNNNTALGVNALGNSAGSGNIAIGKSSGSNLMAGNDNIYLGSPGGAATESDTLRLGSVQTRAFVAGVAFTPVTRSKAVRIDGSGQLGVLVSSARYKRDIEAMGTRSQDLFTLRPVIFRDREEPEGMQQYGLIAEEVATVYPELVTRTATGEVEGVDYEALIPMLLNELQRQQQVQDRQQRELVVLKAQQEWLMTELMQMRTDRVVSAVTPY